MTDTVNVPRETTREMWAAGGTAACNMQHQHHDAIVEAVWRAMLAAAPKAEPLSNPQQLEDQTEAQKGNQAARLYAVATGANVEDVYGSEWCADPAVTFRTDLASILSHPAPSSELLEALSECREVFASGRAYTPEACGCLDTRIEILIAKHKGPQS